MDAFSRYHPLINFTYFIGAIGCGVVIMHPAYIIAGIFGAALYYILLKKSKAIKSMLLMLPLATLLALVNPIFNTDGEHILFYVFNRPYTAEALIYGAVVAGIFMVMMIWFGCYNVVMTGDKFTALFGNLIPSVSLLLVMVFRMIPAFIRKTKAVTDTRRSIGKGAGSSSALKEKLSSGMTVLSSMISWALDGSIVTADSMRARGYGTAKRRSFMIYRMTLRDWVLLVIQTHLFTAVLISSISGHAHAAITPSLSVAPVSWGFYAYCIYLLIPSVLHFKEAIQWHISKSEI